MKHLKKYETYFGNINIYNPLPLEPNERFLIDLRELLDEKLNTSIYLNKNKHAYYISFTSLDYLMVSLHIKRNSVIYDVEFYNEKIQDEETFQLVDITKKVFPSVEELIAYIEDLYNFFQNKKIEYVLSDYVIDIELPRLEYIQDLHKYNEEIEELKNKHEYLFDAKDMGLL